MKRAWVAVVAAFAIPASASAQDGSVTESSHPLGGVGIDTLPGVERVKAAGPLAPGLGFGAAFTYGFTEDILQESDSHHRAGGALAVSFGLSQKIAFGVRLDARYDSHTSDVSGDDSGSTIEGRGIFRAAHAVSPTLSLGSEIALWMKGGSLCTDSRITLTLGCFERSRSRVRRTLTPPSASNSRTGTCPKTKKGTVPFSGRQLALPRCLTKKGTVPFLVLGHVPVRGGYGRVR